MCLSLEHVALQFNHVGNIICMIVFRYETLPPVSPRFGPPEESSVLLDPPMTEDLDSEINSVYNKRPIRNLLT